MREASRLILGHGDIFVIYDQNACVHVPAGSLKVRAIRPWGVQFALFGRLQVTGTLLGGAGRIGCMSSMPLLSFAFALLLLVASSSIVGLSCLVIGSIPGSQE